MEKMLKFLGIVFLVLLVYFLIRFQIPEAPGYCTSLLFFLLILFTNKKKAIRRQNIYVRRTFFGKKLIPGTSWISRIMCPEIPSIDNLSAARNLWQHSATTQN
jgi:hypothetical protein